MDDQGQGNCAPAGTRLTRTIGTCAPYAAVTRLLDPARRQPLRRWPEPSADTAGPESTEQNLRAATRDLASSGWVAAQVAWARTGAGGTRTTSPIATPATILDQIWRLPAAEASVPAAHRAQYPKRAAQARDRAHPGLPAALPRCRSRNRGRARPWQPRTHRREPPPTCGSTGCGSVHPRRWGWRERPAAGHGYGGLLVGDSGGPCRPHTGFLRTADGG